MLIRFKFQTVTTGQFRDFFVEFMDSKPLSPSVREDVKELNWKELFLTKGDLTFIPDFANSLSAAAEVLASEWNELAVDETFQFAASAQDMVGWSSQQVCIFLEELLDNDVIPLAVLERLDSLYQFSLSGNAEIKLRWQTLCLKSKADFIFPQVVAFVTSQGRMKFVRPLYRALCHTEEGGKLALATFAANKHM